MQIRFAGKSYLLVYEHDNMLTMPKHPAAVKVKSVLG